LSEDESLAARELREFLETPLHRMMGLEVLRQESPSVVTMELSDQLRGAAPGSVHGGMLATLADVTCALALSRTYDVLTEMPVTTDMHVRYYRQPRSGPLKAEGSIVHLGRRLRSVECAVVDAEDRTLIRATATYMMLPQAAPGILAGGRAGRRDAAPGDGKP
jgi:uncharacterized protein (TIGR00369 family)